MEYKTRKHPRLKQFDYGENAFYFITICTKNRQQCLCNITGKPTPNGEKITVTLTPTGQIVYRDLLEIPTHFPQIGVEQYAIMPDHIHMIVSVNCPGGNMARADTHPTVCRVVGNFKGGVTRKCGRPIWQTSFYDHVIRNQFDFEETWQYIQNNPKKWWLDGKK